MTSFAIVFYDSQLIDIIDIQKSSNRELFNCLSDNDIASFEVKQFRSLMVKYPQSTVHVIDANCSIDELANYYNSNRSTFMQSVLDNGHVLCSLPE